MPNDSKAARDRKIHELVHAPEHQGEFGEALLLSEIYEAGYSAAIEEAAQIADDSSWCETNNCAGGKTVAAAIRSLKGKNHA